MTRINADHAAVIFNRGAEDYLTALTWGKEHVQIVCTCFNSRLRWSPAFDRLASEMAPYVDSAPLTKLIPTKRALKIAAKNDFVERHIWPTFDYYAEADSFVWIIEDSEPVTKKGVCLSQDPLMSLIQIGYGPYRRVFIEAHTGRILKRDCFSFVSLVALLVYHGDT